MVWVEIGLIVIAMIVLMFIFNRVMAKVLKVEKKRLFSFNHVNELHKKIDGILRITYLAVYIVFSFRMIETGEFANSAWYFIGIVFIYFLLDELLRAFMEWKYATNRKDYLYTLSEMLFMSSIILVLVQTNFMGVVD